MHIDLIIESENVFTGTDAATRPAAVAISGDESSPWATASGRARLRPARNEGGAPEVRDFGDALVVPGIPRLAPALLPFGRVLLALGLPRFSARTRPTASSDAGVRRVRPNGWLLAQGWREYRWDPPVLPSKRSARRRPSPPAPWRCTRATPIRCG